MTEGATLTLRGGRAHPAVGLGTWELTEDTAATVAEALRLGYRLIDTSGDYGTQPGIREALRRSDVDRDQVFLVTEVEGGDDAYDATRRNLTELGVDHVDLMLIHRPPADGAGVELWEGLLRACDAGLTREVGISNYAIEQIETLVDATGEVPAVNQIEWSPFGWSREMLEYCRERRILLQAYSPLTRSGRLDDERLVKIATEHDKTLAQVVLRWSLQIGTVPLPQGEPPRSPRREPRRPRLRAARRADGGAERHERALVGARTVVAVPVRSRARNGRVGGA